MARRNRSRLEIMVQIIAAIEVDNTVGSSVTLLMRRVETSYAAVIKYLNEAIVLGLVEQHKGFERGKTFTVTEKGRIFIKKYLGLTDMIAATATTGQA